MDQGNSTKSATWLLLAILGGTFLLFVVFIVLAAGAVAGGGKLGVSSAARVGVVEVLGVMMESKGVLEDLQEFARDPSVKAVVVRIDSPGGAVAPAQEIFREIRRMRDTKKVVASMGTVAASGGFYVACGADYIMASPGTITGSIGVISQFTHYPDLLKAAKVDITTIKSGKFKDMGSPLKPMEPETLQLFQDVIDNVYDQFVNDVARSRKLPVEEVRPVADGRIFSGAMALEAKLIDGTGNFQDAIEKASEMAGIHGDPEVVYPREHRSKLLRELFDSAAESLAHALLPSQGVSLQYLLPMGR